MWRVYIYMFDENLIQLKTKKCTSDFEILFADSKVQAKGKKNGTKKYTIT